MTAVPRNLSSDPLEAILNEMAANPAHLLEEMPDIELNRTAEENIAGFIKSCDFVSFTLSEVSDTLANGNVYDRLGALCDLISLAMFPLPVDKFDALYGAHVDEEMDRRDTVLNEVLGIEATP